MKQYLEVGFLNNTHGIKGELKMTLWCDGFDYLKQFKTLYLDSEGKNPLNIEKVRPQKQGAIIKFKEINSPEEAQNIKGKTLYGNRDDARLPDGRNYIQDIIGCYVVDVDTEEEYGKVTDVLNYGSCDIYDIESQGKHTLIPAIDDVVKEVNTEFEVVKIKPMKGLFDED